MTIENLIQAIETLASVMRRATEQTARMTALEEQQALVLGRFSERLEALEKSVKGVRDENGNELIFGTSERSLLSRIISLEGRMDEQKSENNSERIDSLGQMVANARDSIEEMKAEIEELKNSDNDQRIDRLEDQVDDLENQSVDPDEFENIVRKVDDLPDFGEFRDQLAMLDNLDPEIGGRVTALETMVQVAAGEFGKIKQCFASITEVTEAL